MIRCAGEVRRNRFEWKGEKKRENINNTLEKVLRRGVSYSLEWWVHEGLGACRPSSHTGRAYE